MIRIAPLAPYAAVALGVYGADSALAALLLYHLAMLAVVVLHRRTLVKSRANQSSRLLWALLVTAVSAMGGMMLYAVWPLLGRDGSLVAGRLDDLGVDRAIWPWFAVYFSIINAVLEELFWRGALGSESCCLTVNDLFFGGYHGLVAVSFVGPMWGLLILVCCVFAGWTWRRLAQASGGLALPIFTHIVADVSIVAGVQMRVFG